MTSKSVSKSGGGDSVTKSGGTSRTKSRETEREPDYFETVTGRSPAQRQAWRDNFNGGAPAGDLTGNIPQGDGSSGPPPTRGRGGGLGFVSGNPGSAVTAGPGSAGATKPGSAQAGPGAVGDLIPTLETKITEFKVGGITMKPHPGTSNMEEVETRWGDAEFLSPAWFTSWSIAGIDTVTNINRMRDEFGQNLIRGIEQGITRHNNEGWVEPNTPFNSLAGPMSTNW